MAFEKPLDQFAKGAIWVQLPAQGSEVPTARGDFRSSVWLNETAHLTGCWRTSVRQDSAVSRKRESSGLLTRLSNADAAPSMMTCLSL